jgi:hypothetical protein
MVRCLVALTIVLLTPTACGGGNGGGTTAPAEAKTYAGLSREEAEAAIKQTIPEANEWIRNNAGNAQVEEGTKVEPLADFIPNGGGAEAWGAQLPLQGDIFGNPNANVCIWVWTDPVDQTQFRSNYSIC